MSHFDVVIVGAGLSGIGAACHLKQRCPDKTFALLERREAIGGTWDLYRYPGIRSDSDMHTLGYAFKPWLADEAIADGPSILEYVNETADEYDVRRHILFGRRVVAAEWSTPDARWTLRVRRGDAGETADEPAEQEEITCNFLLMCSGYYSYDEPYRPAFEGEEDFEGPMFHPQEWPDDFDHAGKRVVVIGSGATAMTIVPAMAETAEHVTMLQRSPTWVVSRPDRDVVANFLRKILPAALAYRITRAKNVFLQQRVYEKTRTDPKKVRDFLLRQVRKHLGPDYDVEKHFTPRYDPWDQRLCLIPNADLFEAIKAGRASVVTDHIDRITKRGIRLASGEELQADAIIVATGLNLELLGGAQFAVDGRPVHFPDTFSYKGMMFSGVPNLVQTFGYINASWTLRADLTAEYTCRLLRHMDERGLRQCTPTLRESDRDMPKRPWIQDFPAGYMRRGMHLFPRQGDREPWLNTQRYSVDRKLLREAPLEDGVLRFGNPAAGRAQGDAADAPERPGPAGRADRD
jgi:cation diffusion facilitator CzcD-associated flavoprotein CzcO